MAKLTVQYTMVEVTKEAWGENFSSNNTTGIPQYFYTDMDEGVIRVWPKPTSDTHFSVSAHVSHDSFRGDIKDG